MSCFNKIFLICPRKIFAHLLVLVFLIGLGFSLQAQRYVVEKAPFSTRVSDEFSPVFYKGGIAFCSNQRDNSLIGYTSEQRRTFNLFYVEKNKTSGWKSPKILAKEITTSFHDGPAIFNNEGNIMYFSRNNSIENSLKNIADTSNKLGIYSAELIDGIWTRVKPFIYNNPLFIFTTPALTYDGKRLYFSSDMLGGYGGMDLYYCNRCGNEWCAPVNMGPVVNTPGNESFPFADRHGKVFFASEGHQGLGGKDIFFTIENINDWIVPVHLDSAINSIADDFGLAMDSTSQSGFFSTNRLNTDDIFIFKTEQVEFATCDTARENNYCFTFYDEQHSHMDTLPVVYLWDFGNGIIRTGDEVKHCFPGSGEYSVRLSIIDEISGDTIAEQVEYKVKLGNIEQAYFLSKNVGIVNQPIAFEAEESYLKGFSVTDYLWDFGDGFKSGGPVMNYAFKKKGEYTVRLGLIASENSLGGAQKTCVSKKIRIYDQ